MLRVLHRVSWTLWRNPLVVASNNQGKHNKWRLYVVKADCNNSPFLWIIKSDINKKQMNRNLRLWIWDLTIWTWDLEYLKLWIVVIMMFLRLSGGLCIQEYICLIWELWSLYWVHLFIYLCMYMYVFAVYKKSFGVNHMEKTFVYAFRTN